MKLLTTIFFCYFYLGSFSQSSEWLKTQLVTKNISTYSRLSYTYSEVSCSDVYAATIDENTIILNACTQKVEKDTLKKFQNMGQIFLGTNDHYYFLCNDQIINESGC